MKILIVLHLFYHDLWGEFKEKLNNIETDFDLIVTLSEDNEDFSSEIKKTFPNDYLIKIHSKKSVYNISMGNIWRNDLINSIMGDKNILTKNLELLKNSENKMCGSKKWCIPVNANKYMEIFKMPNLENKIVNFIGGTMFIVDYNVMLNSFSVKDLDELYEKMPMGYIRDHSVAHKMERILGFVVQNKGYKVIGV